jgi:hypothetical protein
MGMKLKGTVVQYFEADIRIQYPYVAADRDGEIFNYAEVPTIVASGGYFKKNGEAVRVGQADLNGIDWKETLKKFKI